MYKPVVENEFHSVANSVQHVGTPSPTLKQVFKGSVSLNLELLTLGRHCAPSLNPKFPYHLPKRLSIATAEATAVYPSLPATDISPHRDHSIEQCFIRNVVPNQRRVDVVIIPQNF